MNTVRSTGSGLCSTWSMSRAKGRITQVQSDYGEPGLLRPVFALSCLLRLLTQALHGLLSAPDATRQSGSDTRRAWRKRCSRPGSPVPLGPNAAMAKAAWSRCDGGNWPSVILSLQNRKCVFPQWLQVLDRIGNVHPRVPSARPRPAIRLVGCRFPADLRRCIAGE